MSEDVKELLEDIKTHLSHQKALGNDYLPVEEHRNTQKPTPSAKGGSASGGNTQGDERTETSDSTSAEAGLELLREEMGDCTRCKLHSSGRTQIVFGVGNPSADLMFVGEGPGRDEDIQGIPFVGRAGKLLTKIIEAMGLKRDDVYIANVVKCRPPENRNPEPDEIETCQPFLFKQIEIIKPKVIVCLGTFSAQLLLDTDEKISKLRGQLHDFRGTKLLPTYHPAFLLRSPSMKRPVWEDMQKVMEVLGLPPAQAEA